MQVYELWQIAYMLPIGLGMLFAAIYLLVVRREPRWPLRLGAFLFAGLVAFNLVVYWVERFLYSELQSSNPNPTLVPDIMFQIRVLTVFSQAVHGLAIAATAILIAAGRKRSPASDEE
ncbi:MAG: hypothetical protein ACRC8S_09895 [Fimbriiglobus sp.]